MKVKTNLRAGSGGTTSTATDTSTSTSTQTQNQNGKLAGGGTVSGGGRCVGY
jgi:hypothetical protein